MRKAWAMANSVGLVVGARAYRIGTPGTAWGSAEKAEWLAQTTRHRSYQDEVVSKLEALRESSGDVFDVVQYGALPCDAGRYPLFAAKSRGWDASKPCVLVTGGVHGYETSGVQGALLFAQTKARDYADAFNIVVAPCVSPWAYEHIQRWNPSCLDPNRSFKQGGTTEESSALMGFLDSLDVASWKCHVDLHETTDTDDTEFMPAKYAEVGEIYEPEGIPDGFYLAGDSLNPQLAWQAAVIEAVKVVTHIAPPNEDGLMIGEKVVQDGLILLPVEELGLCGGVTGAEYATTTEVYPDSPLASDEQCKVAQVAAISGGLDYIIKKMRGSDSTKTDL